jgi:two-component system, OmpR family, phosphate regulon sensor histidine kinase PhoR
MRRNGLWIILFIFLIIVVAVLATGWSVVLVQHYREMLRIARADARGPWVTLLLGSAGFVAVLSLIIAFFVKIVRETRLNQRQSEFLATVSHELKTPLAAMELSSSLLRAGDLSPREIERLWTSHDAELKRLRGEVETLLEAARWQGKAPKIQMAPVMLDAWMARSTDRWKKILGPESVLELQGPGFERACALLDEHSLNIIVDNLLDNARKFSKGPPHVVLRASRHRPISGRGPYKWELRVKDHGRGFEPEDSEKLFERFFRAKTDAPYAIPGSGLGLYLAASASRALKLTIRAESAGLGKGATFVIEGSEIGE